MLTQPGRQVPLSCFNRSTLFYLQCYSIAVSRAVFGEPSYVFLQDLCAIKKKKVAECWVGMDET